MIGQRARCAGCSLAFTISAPSVSNKPAPAKPPASKPQEAAAIVPEHVGFDCRVCSTRLFARTEDVGGKLKCPDCGALTVIPPPPPPKPKNMPPALEGEQYELWDIDEQPLPSQLIAAQPKSVMLKCRRCDTVMHPEARLVGQPIRCPDCGTTNLVPPQPRPVVRPTVLTPDAQTPFLDPDADPGERPYVPAPVGTMLHEDEHEAEYRRALEKSQRTGKPMEIDHRGRPIMPRWPLISGVLPFLISRAVPVVWIGMSVGLACAIGLLVAGIAAASAGEAFVGVPMLAIGSALTMIAASGTYSCLLQIIMESSEGNRAVYHWPGLMDWFASLLWLGVAVPFSTLPGWAIGRIPGVGTDPQVAALLNTVSVLIFLPIIILSQLDINSPAGILSGRILGSLLRCPFSWMLFYFEITALAAICGGATYWVVTNYPTAARWLMLLYTIALILFARLLGRLAWRLADAMPLEDDLD
jgi:DNA-directed RNA polymerase subunit RPC12/RpoP